MTQKEFTKAKLEEFYKLYEEGRKNDKAPVSYIDFFKARKFLFDALAEQPKIIEEKFFNNPKEMMMCEGLTWIGIAEKFKEYNI